MLSPAAAALAPPDDLLRELLAVSLTGVIFYTPQYDPADSGEIIDFTFEYLNQRLLERMAVTSTILVAGNGQEALALLHEHYAQSTAAPCPALILLDMKMPLMNGVEFLQAYAQRPRAQNPAVVIMLTTSLNPDDVVRMQNLPIAGYLTKPLTSEKISHILTQYFGHAAPAS